MKTIYAFLFLIIVGLVSNQAIASVDIFMRIKDANGNVINGESVAQNYANWTELKAYGSSISSSITIGSASSGSAGKSTFDTLQLQVPLSSISLPISKILTTGSRLSEVDIYFVKAGGSYPTNCQCAFYKIHLEDVFVSNISESYDGEGISQQISLKPVKIAWAYYKQSTTGTLPTSPTNQHGWDYSRNIAFSYSF